MNFRDLPNKILDKAVYCEQRRIIEAEVRLDPGQHDVWRCGVSRHSCAHLRRGGAHDGHGARPRARRVRSDRGWLLAAAATPAPTPHNSTGAPGTRHPLHRTVCLDRATSSRVRTREKHARHTPPPHGTERLLIASTDSASALCAPCSTVGPSSHVQHKETEVHHEKEPRAEEVHAN